MPRKRRTTQTEECEVVDVVTSSKTGQKNKLKLGSKDSPKTKSVKAMKAASVSQIVVDEIMSVENEITDVSHVQEDDDEEAWLDALEKGDLDDYGELKKEKDPSLMTARQRAMKDRTTGSGPSYMMTAMLSGSGSKVEVMTEEAQKRKEEKNKRRKLQAVKKAEENQKQTIERLVKQQGVRGSKDRQKKNNTNSENGTNSTPQQQATAKTVPMIKYTSKGSSITLSYPDSMECPLKAKVGMECGVKPLCVVCGNPKNYNCSKTKAPLCSLNCYQTNLAKVAG